MQGCELEKAKPSCPSSSLPETCSLPPFGLDSDLLRCYPETYAKVAGLRPSAQELFQVFLRSSWFNSRKANIENNLRRGAGSRLDGFTVRYVGEAFEQISYIFINNDGAQRIKPEEIIAAPHQAKSLYNHNDYFSGKADGLVFIPDGDRTIVGAACEYTTQFSWNDERKERQIRRYNSGEIITDLLTIHPSGGENGLLAKMKRLFPDLPPNLYFDRDCYRTIYTLPRGKHRRAHVRLKSNPHVYLMPIGRGELNRVIGALFRDVQSELVQADNHYYSQLKGMDDNRIFTIYISLPSDPSVYPQLQNLFA